MNSLISSIQPIHPFPARMASAIALEELSSLKKRIRVLDPMMGSGTTLAVARSTGNLGIGFDTDPLALLMTKTWCSDLTNPEAILTASEILLNTAKKMIEKLDPGKAYPKHADEETREFIDFWFDQKTRKELSALSLVIDSVENQKFKNLFWCAFSRMIITKKVGVSLAMDVSHSRPHKSYRRAPVSPFDFFSKQLKIVLKRMPFNESFVRCNELEKVLIKRGDARSLSLGNKSVDMVITSPPYLNAIDYLRGHKLSLVWMGHNISELRKIRSENIGATKKLAEESRRDLEVLKLCGLNEVGVLSGAQLGMLKRYVFDLDLVISEIERVLCNNGKAIFVIGDCNLGNVFVSNSKIIKNVSIEKGLRLNFIKKRPLPDNRRYLPPPSNSSSGKAMQKRMREEVILSFTKN